MPKIIVDKYLILECLKELSDVDYQKRVWIVGTQNEVSGFNDVVAALFDDSALDEALQKNEITFTIELDDLFRALGEKIGSLPDNLSTKQLINLPKWKDITELAKKIIAILGRDQGIGVTEI